MPYFIGVKKLFFRIFTSNTSDNQTLKPGQLKVALNPRVKLLIQSYSNEGQKLSINQ
jgi:hypothetical protein